MRRLILAGLLALLAFPVGAQTLPTAGQYYQPGATVPHAADGVEQVGIDSITGSRCMVGEPSTGSCQLPISGSISATNPSVGAVSSTAPTSATLIGGTNGGDLKSATIDGSGNLNVNVAAGSSGNAAASATGATVPTDADYGGLNNGGNLIGAIGDSSGREIVVGAGTAGTATGGVMSVQGAASMTPVQVSQATAGNLNATVTLAAGSALAGKVGIDQTTPGTTNAVSTTNFPSTVATGTGAQGATSPRVTVATDSATVAGSASLPAGTNLIGKSGIDQTTPGTTNGVSLSQVGSTTVATGNGVSSSGSQRVNIASDNTAFPVNAQPTPTTSGGLSICFLQALATSNSTNCKSSAGQIYHIRITNNSTSPAYLHLINSSSAPTCSSATTVDEIMVPGGTNGAGAVADVALGEAFATGISFCFSGGIANNDNTSVAASTYLITVLYK